MTADKNLLQYSVKGFSDPEALERDARKVYYPRSRIPRLPINDLKFFRQ